MDALTVRGSWHPINNVFILFYLLKTRRSLAATIHELPFGGCELLESAFLGLGELDLGSDRDFTLHQANIVQ